MCSRLGSGSLFARARLGGFAFGALLFFALAATLGQLLFLSAQRFGLRLRFLTKTRFLRTSTWIVRDLPLASACLISLVDLRTSVIFLRSPVVPCALRRNSSRRSLSASVSVSLADFFDTPADSNCSSSAAAGRFSSVASWATVVTAIVGLPSVRLR